MTFIVDGNTLGSFEYVPVSDGVTTFTPNQTVFSTTNLSNIQHTLQIQSGHKNQQAVVLLDTIVYTKDDSDEASSTSGTGSASNSIPSSSLSLPTSSSGSFGTTSTSRPHVETGVIVGAVLAALSVMGIVGIFIYCLRRRRRQQRRPSWETEANPLVITGVTISPNTIDARVASKNMSSVNMRGSAVLRSSGAPPPSTTSTTISSSYYTLTDETPSVLPAYSQVFS